MINNLLENPFLNSRMSNDDFGLLVLGHIQFLKAQNKSKAFDKMIAKLEPNYNGFQEFLNSQNKANTEKAGKTMSVKSILKNFNAFIDDLNDEIISWKRKKPEVFNSFFPSGKKEYKGASITEIEALMKRLSDACANNKDISKANTALAAQFLADFKLARELQLGGKGEVKEGSDDGKNIRAALAKAMYSVLIDLIQLNIDDTEKVKTFYESQFINPKASKKAKKKEEKA